MITYSTSPTQFLSWASTYLHEPTLHALISLLVLPLKSVEATQNKDSPWPRSCFPVTIFAHIRNRLILHHIPAFQQHPTSTHQKTHTNTHTLPEHFVDNRKGASRTLAADIAKMSLSIQVHGQPAGTVNPFHLYLPNAPDKRCASMRRIGIPVPTTQTRKYIRSVVISLVLVGR